MKKIILILVASAMFIPALFAQTYVGTEPENKNVILEEFTGVKCPNCPDGHAVAASILNNNPGDAFVIAFHPYNSSFTAPYPNNPDFRRHHPDSLYMIPYCGSSRYMPSAFINRRIWNNERLQSRTVWESYAGQFLTEASPVNVGLATSYDETTKELEVLVEIYYTADMTDPNTLNVVFTEGELVAQQSGGSTNYVHHHIFRETFTDQWGDIIEEPTTQGSFIQQSFTFDNSAEEYNMEHCEVIAYIVNAANDEVISGIGVWVGENTNNQAPVADFEASLSTVIVDGSVAFTDLSTGGPTSWSWAFDGGNPATSNLQEPPEVVYSSPGTYSVSLTVTNDNGSSTETKTDYISVGYAPGADFMASDTIVMEGEHVSFTDLSLNNPTSWYWHFEDAYPESSTEQHPADILFYSGGYHSVSLTVTNEFGVDSLMKEDLIYVSPVGSNEFVGEKVSIYPNPVDEFFEISTSDLTGLNSVFIYDIRGRMIDCKSTYVDESLLRYDAGNLKAGVYYVVLKFDSESITKKFLIRR